MQFLSFFVFASAKLMKALHGVFVSVVSLEFSWMLPILKEKLEPDHIFFNFILNSHLSYVG